jgi:hypothetical protein
MRWNEIEASKSQIVNERIMPHHAQDKFQVNGATGFKSLVVGSWDMLGSNSVSRDGKDQQRDVEVAV